MTLYALVATHDDGTDFLWTTPSAQRQAHEHALQVYARDAAGKYAMRIVRFVEVKEGD